jgi:hypothetical protein
MRKTEKELYDFLQEVSCRTGEDPIEYVGYGYAKSYAKFLYEYFKKNYTEVSINIDDLLKDITFIWAYLDVYLEFIDPYENIHHEWDGNDDLEFELMSKFLVSNYCSDDAYKNFIDELSEL